MKRKINLLIFTLVLTAVLSITSVCGRTGGGHSSHGHSSHGGHSGYGHSSSGHSSSGHSSSGHSSSGQSSSGHSSSGYASEGHISSGHASEGHIGSGYGRYGSYGSYGHENSGNTGEGYGSEGRAGLGHAYDGSHHSDVDSRYHYDPRGQNYHNSETNLESEGHHNYGSGGSGYHFGGGYHHYPHHHQAHGHYGSDTYEPVSTTTTTTTPAPKIEESWLDLSCNNKLPKFMGKNYPKKKVEAVIRKMNMNKHSGQVTFEVQAHLIQRIMTDFNTPGGFNLPGYGYYQSGSTTTGCDEIKSRTAPLGGCDIKDQAYIIVNVPDLEQVIKTADCRSTFNMCSDNYDNSGLCLQSKKEQDLLVLPAKRGPYNISDLSVATFKLNDGCKCRATEEIKIEDMFG